MLSTTAVEHNGTLSKTFSEEKDSKGEVGDLVAFLILKLGTRLSYINSFM